MNPVGSLTAPASRTAIGPIAIIGLLFFIMGFFTWLNGPLIGFVKLAFDLNDVNAFWCRWRSTCPASSLRCRRRPCSSARA